MAQEKRNLPMIRDLYDEKDVELLKRENELNVLLNQQPKEDWIRNHPIAKKEIVVEGQKKTVPIQYIAIGRIEWLLTRIFINWHVEIKTIQLIGNSVVVCVRLHYQSVTDGEWHYQDGVGANPLQTDKDAGAIDFNKLKSSAVQIATPAAESYAIKDAAEKLGKLFGKDLNRADEIGYDMLINTFETEKKPDILLASKKIIEALEHYQGQDKDEIKKGCALALKDNTITIEYLQQIAKKIGTTL
ncbi:MAG: hypothetical protein IMZ53_00425 [Thermoplasmata archaeon]|nr:hypothetical protein [Thermoplasmata archaeon]